MRRSSWPVGPAIALALLLGGCSAPGSGGYLLTAYFDRAVALFEESRIKVMGVDVGLVETIEIENDASRCDTTSARNGLPPAACIRVDMRIDRNVPLPVDVTAAILPLTLIGERNILLFPPWQPGDQRIKDGAVVANTRIPVEPDDVLEALSELVQAIDPHRVERFLADAAGAVDGRGEAFNHALEQSARLTGLISQQDENLLRVGENLRRLAAALNSRESQLQRLLDAYAETADILAAERAAIQQFLASTLRLIDEGAILIETYEGRLAGDLAGLTEIALVLRANVHSVDQFIHALPAVADVLREAHNPETHSVTIRLDGGPSLNDFFRSLLDILGVPGDVCIPIGTTCEASG